LKAWIVFVAIGALVCAGLNWLVPGTVLDGFAFAIPAGILSAVHAGRLRHPVWSGLLALMTVAGVVSISKALPIAASIYYGLFRPSLDTAREYLLLVLVPVVALPLAALLATILVHPGKPRPAEPVEPPTGTS
jgi:hypothetical protein